MSCSSGAVAPDESRVHASKAALDPIDIFPPTTFSMTLLVRPANFVPMINDLGQPEPWPWTTAVFGGPNTPYPTTQYPYAFTPLGLQEGPAPGQLPASGVGVQPTIPWNIAASIGVKVNSSGWLSAACLIGDISGTMPPDYSDPKYNVTSSPCAAQLPGGVGTNSLRFGAAGVPLAQTFQVTNAADTIDFGVALDNVGPSAVPAYTSSASSAFGSEVTNFGGDLQAVGVLIGLADGPVGGVIGGVGTILSAVGTMLPVSSAVSATTPTPNQMCLGGIVGNPPAGSTVSPDTLSGFTLPDGSKITARTLYDATANGPLTLTADLTMNWAPPNGPLLVGYCRSMTQVILTLDRAADSSNGWQDGLAFQPRSADSTVAIASNTLASIHPLVAANDIEVDFRSLPDSGCPIGIASCMDGFQGGISFNLSTTALGGVPSITSSQMPIVALSGAENVLTAFFVDGNGVLWVGGYNDGSPFSWQTRQVGAGFPPNASLAVVRGVRGEEAINGSDSYVVFWINNNGDLENTVVGLSPQGVTDSGVTIIAAKGTPGGPLAAVATSPDLADVFVVGYQGTPQTSVIWDITGNPAQVTGWSASPLSTTVNNVNALSGITAVAPSERDLDVFFFDASGTLQRLFWANQTNSSGARVWSSDPSVGARAAVRSGGFALSAVSRSPQNIDVMYQCAAGLCVLPIGPGVGFSNPGINPAPSPASQPSTNGLGPPFSLIASGSFSLDAVAHETGTATAYADAAWQNGATSWAVEPHPSLSPALLSTVLN